VDGEGRAGGGALHADIPTVPLDQRAGDGQAEAHAARLAGPAGIDPVEAVEQVA